MEIAKEQKKEVLLAAKDMRKVYQLGELEIEVIKGISFEVFQGEFIVVLGPSGSGKSTVLNMMGGIDELTAGELYYKDKPIHDLGEKGLTNFRRDHVGFVFQFYNLIPNLTAKENIDLAAEVSKNPIDSDVLLDKIDLLDRADYFPSKLSGGQQQRVAIARAIAKNPDLLLCDEPTGALDVNTGIGVLSLLLEFNKEYNKTVVIITHNSEISKIGDRTFYIKDGLIDKIIENPHRLSPEEVDW